MYITLTNLVNMVMVGMTILFSFDKWLVLGVLVGGNALLVLLTATFRFFTGYAPANTPVLQLWRAGIYAAAGWAALSSMYALNQNPTDKPPAGPIIMWLAGWGVLAVILLFVLRVF
jgi:hypothetical protein